MPGPGLLAGAALHILTLNIWGLPDAGLLVVSPLRQERVVAICEELKAGPWDVVLLQEAWVSEDREILRQCGYPHIHSVDDPQRLLDSGLMILSRHPMDRTNRLTYPANGDPAYAWEDGEAFARKSALIARVIHPQLGPVWVGNTHLVARYGQDQDRYFRMRKNQFERYVLWAKTAASTDPLVLGGDFNFDPAKAEWRDSLNLLNGFNQAGPSGACTLCKENPVHVGVEERVDQVWASPAFAPMAGGATFNRIIDIEGVNSPFSDHWGWEGSFKLR